MQSNCNCKPFAVLHHQWGWPSLHAGQEQGWFSLGKSAHSCRCGFSLMSFSSEHTCVFLPCNPLTFNRSEVFFVTKDSFQSWAVLNNHQVTKLETGPQKREINHSQSSKWTNERFHAPSWDHRDVILIEDVLQSSRSFPPIALKGMG